VGKMRRPSSQITATDTADFSRRFLWNLRNINHSHLMAEKKIPLPVGHGHITPFLPAFGLEILAIWIQLQNNILMEPQKASHF